MRRFATIAMLAAVLAGLLVGAGQASAWTGPSRIVSTRSAPLDWCPGGASICQDTRRLTTLGARTAVNMVCWVDARTPSGFRTPRWFYVTLSGYQGFIKAELVTNQKPNSPWCLDNGTAQRRAVVASLQATGTAEIYQKYPTTTDKSNALKVYGFNSWGAYSDWSGDCVMYVGLSWWRAHQKIHSGATAAAIARTYALHGGTPPRGAAVFWSWGSIGHVAISLGNGRVVTTRGLDNDRLSTTDASMATVGSGKKYLGWAPTP